MAGTTIVNYDEMRSISAHFKTMAENISDLAKTTNAKVADLHEDKWIGRGSDKFFQEMDQLVKPALAKLVQALDLTAVVAEDIVKIISQADEEVKSSFIEYSDHDRDLGGGD